MQQANHQGKSVKPVWENLQDLQFLKHKVTSNVKYCLSMEPDNQK